MTLYHHESLQPSFLLVLMALVRRFLLETPRSPPCGTEYQILDGSHPSQDALLKCFADAQCSLIFPGEEDLDTGAVVELMTSWPLLSGTEPITPLHHYRCDAKKLNTQLQRLFSTCYHNVNLKEDFINSPSEFEIELHTFLGRNPVQPSQQASNPLSEALCLNCVPVQVMPGQLLVGRSAPRLPAPSRLRCCGPGPPGNGPASDSDTRTLNQLFASIRMNKADPSFQKQYVAE